MPIKAGQAGLSQVAFDLRNVKWSLPGQLVRSAYGSLFLFLKPAVEGTLLSIRNEPEYPFFDLLRFVLALVVLLDHLRVFSWSHFGNLSVQVFFALSGWLIGQILLETKAADLNKFYFNRVTRVWIPYFFTLTALYLASTLFETTRSTGWWESLLFDVTFTHNWFTLWPDPKLALEQMPFKGTGNGLWSISVEEQFYLISPLIITLLPFGKSIPIWSGIAVWALGSEGYYASICFGVLSAVLFKNQNWIPNSYKVVCTCLAMLLFSVLTMWRVPNSYLLAAPFFAVSIVLLCAQPGHRTALTKWIGGLSYPLYLNAWMGLFIFHAVEKKLGLPSDYIGRVLIEILFATGGAIATYHLIDKQVMKYRARFFSPYLGWLLAFIAYILLFTGVGYYFWFK